MLPLLVPIVTTDGLLDLTKLVMDGLALLVRFTGHPVELVEVVFGPFDEVVGRGELGSGRAPTEHSGFVG